MSTSSEHADTVRAEALESRARASAPPWTSMHDLAGEHMGGAVIAWDDDFFAEAANLIRREEPRFDAERFTDRGKWMDGWETRRRRTPGHDWAIVQLGTRAHLAGVDVDTAHFVGNAPSHAAIDIADWSGEAPDWSADAATDAGSTQWMESIQWIEAVPQQPVRDCSHNWFPIAEAGPATLVRLRIYPDGGVARLRVYGTPAIDWQQLIASATRLDLACATVGGRVLDTSDRFFAHPENLILPTRPRNMGEGWETRRRRGPGHDWITVALGHRARIDEVVVDTAFYKGNFPESCEVAARRTDAPEGDWTTIVARTPLMADAVHRLEVAATDSGPWDELRLTIHPDGGVARLQAFGVPTESGPQP